MNVIFDIADVLLDWSDDPAPGSRFAVYGLSGAEYDQAVRIGTTDGSTDGIMRLSS